VLLPTDPVELIMVVTIAIIAIIMYRAVTASDSSRR
jgi:hypothetical protein